MSAVSQFQKLLGEVNRLEGYDPEGSKLPIIVPYCKRHRCSYAPEVTLDGMLLCPACVAEADEPKRKRIALGMA